MKYEQLVLYEINKNIFDFTKYHRLKKLYTMFLLLHNTNMTSLRHTYMAYAYVLVLEYFNEHMYVMLKK